VVTASVVGVVFQRVRSSSGAAAIHTPSVGAALDWAMEWPVRDRYGAGIAGSDPAASAETAASSAASENQRGSRPA
jgi:hypothetical protein